MKDLLLEKKRSELLAKSQSADIVKSYGTTRYGGRNRVSVYNSTGYINSVDMNALFKADLLDIVIPIKGETGNYDIEVLFDGVLKAIRQQVKANNDVLEYKCIYRAIINAINSQDILIACSCPDWKYRMAYHASKGRYNSGKTQLVPAKVTNPHDTKGAGCKHVMNVLVNLDWALKLATSVFNYVNYMEANYEDKYADIIFPAIYGQDYDWAAQQDYVNDIDDSDLEIDDSEEIDDSQNDAEPPENDESDALEDSEE